MMALNHRHEAIYCESKLTVVGVFFAVALGDEKGGDSKAVGLQ
jgi:hypothetical protein